MALLPMWGASVFINAIKAIQHAQSISPLLDCLQATATLEAVFITAGVKQLVVF